MLTTDTDDSVSVFSCISSVNLFFYGKCFHSVKFLNILLLLEICKSCMQFSSHWVC